MAPGTVPTVTTVRSAPTTPPAYRPFHLRRGLFGTRQCDRIVALGLDAAAAAGTVVDLAGGTGLRDCTVAWLPCDDSTAWIRERLRSLAATVNRHYGFDLTGVGEDLQFTTYTGPGGHYTWHQDGLDRGVERRKLSVVVQLSDPGAYEGGDLEFLEVAEDYGPAQREEFRHLARARGTAIAFPAFEYHRVLPVRAGVRHSLVWWLDGPPFR